MMPFTCQIGARPYKQKVFFSQPGASSKLRSALLTILGVTLLLQSGCVGVTGVAASKSSLSSASSSAGSPAIVTQPASQTVAAGQIVAFSVTCTGTAPLAYQWQKNGANISGATAATYTTPATTASDNGAQFAVVVSNGAGSVSSNAAILTVNTAPSIINQPTSQNVTAGQTATFSVSATGAAPLTYQWLK